VTRAVEAERAHTRAWLHDGVLQLLEYIAAGGYAETPDVPHLRQVAEIAAGELRHFVDGQAAAGSKDLGRALVETLDATQLLAPDLTLRLVAGGGIADTPVSLVEPLAAAAGEALANVRKHADATRATVRAEVVAGMLVVRVEDDGRGFDRAGTPLGSGLRLSVIGRMTAIGGHATVESAPGKGTRVVLSVRIADVAPAAEVAA
jgi:signal transduction histidine kinase